MRREREIRYMLDGNQVIVPIDPKMSDEDLMQIATRVFGNVYERTVSDWQNVIVRPTIQQNSPLEEKK